MNAPIALSVRMFGAFKKYHPETLSLNLPVGSTAAEVKAAIATALRQSNPAFGNDDLIDKSVLADNQRILGNDERILASASLAILPPVCGG